jgi:hypothetical protein
VVWFPGSQTFSKLSADETAYGRRTEFRIIAHRIQLNVRLDIFCKLDCFTVITSSADDKSSRLNSPVSPASPENAIIVCSFNFRVLSSVALRMVTPLKAAFEAATRTKSFPVMPISTSLRLR